VTQFFKVSGGGNDFLALIEPERPPDQAEIVAWCARGLSMGADGVFVLRRAGAAIGMDYWNSDGRPAALCVNGTRCAARLAFELGRMAPSYFVGLGVLVSEATEVCDEMFAAHGYIVSITCE